MLGKVNLSTFHFNCALYKHEKHEFTCTWRFNATIVDSHIVSQIPCIWKKYLLRIWTVLYWDYFQKKIVLENPLCNGHPVHLCTFESCLVSVWKYNILYFFCICKVWRSSWTFNIIFFSVIHYFENILLK